MIVIYMRPDLNGAQVIPLPAPRLKPQLILRVGFTRIVLLRCVYSVPICIQRAFIYLMVIQARPYAVGIHAHA